MSTTFGGGSVNLQKLSLDSSTYLDLRAAFNNAGTEVDLTIGKFTANGSMVLYLPGGNYQLTITTATAVYARAARIPGE